MSSGILLFYVIQEVRVWVLNYAAASEQWHGFFQVAL
jgi:hypothetical protein